MTADEIIDAAAVDGSHLEERICRGHWVHGWRRGGDERWPCFLTRREALSWMGDRLKAWRGVRVTWEGGWVCVPCSMIPETTGSRAWRTRVCVTSGSRSLAPTSHKVRPSGLRLAEWPFAAERDTRSERSLERSPGPRRKQHSRGYSWHDLRHHHASVLLSNGVSPALVAERLGHDVKTLLNTYAHVIRADDDRVRSIVDAAFAGSADFSRTEAG